MGISKMLFSYMWAATEQLGRQTQAGNTHLTINPCAILFLVPFQLPRFNCFSRY